MSNPKFGNPNTILDRIRSAYGIVSDADLARFLSVSASTVATWRKTDSMKYDPVLLAAEEINLNWLFYGSGPVWRRELASAPLQGGMEAVTDPMVTYTKSERAGEGEDSVAAESVPAVDKSKPAPEKEESEEETVWIGFPAGFIYREMGADPDKLFLTRSVGDGMAPTIQDRDFILVKKNDRHPYAGRIYLIRIRESLLCKRIHEGSQNRLILISDNERYEPIEFPSDSEEMEIIGRVIWYGRAL